jgi:propionyl-CoA:succinyl-CoA transferase
MNSFNCKYPILTAEEAADIIENNSTVGFSGFTAAGAAKMIPSAIAEKAKKSHSEGKEYQIKVVAGASTCNSLDGTLADADAISHRYGYQSTKAMRKKINAEKIKFSDYHLSHLPQLINYGFLGNIDYAVIEATDITSDGKVYLSTSIGISPTVLEKADKVFIELNEYHSDRLREMTDIYSLDAPPYRNIIPITNPLDKIGKEYVKIDPSKVVGIINTNCPDEVGSFTQPDQISEEISNNVLKFLLNEISAGRIPKEFLPIQSGVGNIGNAVMNGLGEHPDMPPFTMYTEVLQDSIIGLMKKGRITGASTCALTISPNSLQEIYDNMDFFAPKIVLRPQEISNNPTIARRLGVLAINTALEADIYGNVNSTHVLGTKLMNGIGGSGDFTRNAYLSIFVCPSIAKNGKISSIVPMTPHVDSNEHSVEIIITEQGIADLRGLSPIERAKSIIKNCANPAYKDYLYNYLKCSPGNHIRHDLTKCFELHQNLINYGTMIPK